MTDAAPHTASAFRTAVVPAAGMGTRFLPATKTVPKELLPVVDTPGIELVAGEAADSGAGRLVIVTSPGKDGVVAHFVEDLVLESKLEASGKYHLLEKVRKAPGLLEVESVVQDEPLGLGHAVGCAESVLDDDEDAIAVLLPDDLVMPRGVLETMSRVRRKRGGTVLCAIDVPKDQVSAYGVFEVETVPDATNRTSSRSSAWSRNRPSRMRRPRSPPQVATSSTGRSSMRCGESNPAPAASSSSPTPSPSSSRKATPFTSRAPRHETRSRKSRRLPPCCG